MLPLASTACLSLCLLWGCSSSAKKEKTETRPADPSAQEEVPAGASQPSKPGDASKKPKSKAKSKPLAMRNLLGPFASIDAYCKGLKAKVGPGKEEICQATFPWGLKYQAYLTEPSSPYRAAQVFQEGVNEPDSTATLFCSLGVQVATGWFVLPRMKDCSATTTFLELASGGAAGARYLRVSYREDAAGKLNEIESVGTRDHLLVCGPVAGGKMQCLPDIILRSSVTKTSKTAKTDEKFLLESVLEEDRLVLSKKVGTVPPGTMLGAYPLPFEVPATLDGLALYRRHLKAGRALSKKSKFSEAVIEFEKAVEASAGGRALSELGYAAYRDGDLKKSRRASQRASDSADPRIAAASLYNLGLAQEKEGRKSKAASSYQESLALRPNQSVLARLASVAPPPSPWDPWIDCKTGPLSYADLEECFADEEEGDSEMDESYPMTTSVEIVDQGDYAIVKIRSEDGHLFGDSRFFLAKKLGDKYLLLGTIGSSDWGTEGDDDDDLPLDQVYVGFEIEVHKYETKTVGEREVTRIEYSKQATTTDGSVDSVSLKEDFAILCVVQGGARECTNPIVLGVDWRAELGENASDLDKELFQQRYESKAPASWSYRMQLELVDGLATHSSVQGLRNYKNSYRLWP